jgi:hypothetical protein
MSCDDVYEADAAQSSCHPQAQTSTASAAAFHPQAQTSTASAAAFLPKPIVK